jgi:hypothetical protein
MFLPKIKKIFSGLLFLFILGTTALMQAQENVLGRIEYLNFPQSNSDNSFSRFKSLVKFPIKLKYSGDYFIPGIKYENMNFMFKDDAPFPVESLEHLKSYSVILTYIHKMNEDWRLGLEVEIMATSNFETGELMNEDLEYTGSVFFIKPKKDERLIIGLRYSTATSLKFPLPIINYYKKFDPKWSYI